jgi:hypothetical protein
MRGKNWRRGVGGLAVGFLLGTGVGEGRAAGVDRESAFHEANRQYEQGEYDAAIGAYEELLKDGTGTPALHFNLGNARFKVGEVGRAIWHYRVARELSPRDADVQANLQYARNTVGESIGEGRIGRGVGVLTVDEWTAMSIVLFWFWMGGLIIGQLRLKMWVSLRLWVRLGMVAWLGSVAALAVGLHEQFGKRIAIVVTEGEVRYGPFEESQSHFPVRDGMELRVTDARDGWVRVEDPRRGGGWIARSMVLLYPGE